MTLWSRDMMRAVDDERTHMPALKPAALPYRRTTPPVGQRWAIGEVMLGLIVGLLTILLGLPVFLLWSYQHLHFSGWTPPLAFFGAGVGAMLLGAFAVRRPHQLPGSFPGLLAGIVGGVLVIGFVAFYIMRT